jgi:hypothetical protein
MLTISILKNGQLAKKMGFWPKNFTSTLKNPMKTPNFFGHNLKKTVKKRSKLYFFGHNPLKNGHKISFLSKRREGM